MNEHAHQDTPPPMPLPPIKKVRRVTLKWRLILTLAICLLYLVGRFYSARSITFLTVLACPPTSLILGPLFLLGLFAVTIWNVVGIFTLWRAHKVRSLIPLAVCVPFFFLGGPIGEFGLDRRIREFRTNQPEFEAKAQAVVGEFHDRNRSATGKRPSNHFGNHAGFNIYAETDTNGVPTVRFVRVITMNFHHRGYMYRPDGNFDAAIREREWIQARINGQWSAIGD